MQSYQITGHFTKTAWAGMTLSSSTSDGFVTKFIPVSFAFLYQKAKFEQSFFYGVEC